MFRKLSCADVDWIAIDGDSRRLSLIDAGSSTKASLGAVSGLVVDVTQRGDAPRAFVAVQPSGSAGATTPSKLSLNAVVAGPTTETDAEASPEPPLSLVKEAVLSKVAPHVPLVVLLTMCACALVCAPSVVGL